MDEKIDIGKRVWHLRNEVLHQTQEEFAELIDVTPETISNLERSVVFPSVQTIIKLAEKCGVTTDYLLGIKHDDD